MRMRTCRQRLARAGLATGALLLLVLGAGVVRLGDLAEGAQPRFKILHIMSYYSPWEWTDEQLRGFKAGLGAVDVEYQVFQMGLSIKTSILLSAKVVGPVRLGGHRQAAVMLRAGARAWR